MYEEKHQIEFDNIIERIYERQKEIFKNKKYNNIYEFIPKIYYIGLGKTGSSSTGLSFQNENVAHWHSVEYFEKCYQITYLSSHNLDLYDLILYIGDKFNFKPLIIENIREPISLNISFIYQHIKFDRGCDINCQMCKMKNITDEQQQLNFIKKFIEFDLINYKPESIEMYKKHFNIDIIKEFDNQKHYYIFENDKVKLLLFKYEYLHLFEDVIHKYTNYNCKIGKHNITTKKYIKDNLQIDKSILTNIYSQDYYLNYFYNPTEIQNFIIKYKN